MTSPIRSTTALCAVALSLMACAGPAQDDALSVDEAGAARAAQSAPDLVAVAQAMRARVGTEIAPGLTLSDARAEGDVLVMDFADARAADALSPSERELFAMQFSDDITTQMCAAPATRTFVEERGGVRASIASSDGVTLASETITSCS